MSQFPQRISIRLPGFDYSQPNYYFITICTWQRQNLFGQIIEGKMQLNELGKIIENEWHNIPKHFNNVQIDKFVIMPNHVHGIIKINNNERIGAGLVPARASNISKRATTRVAPTLGNIVGAFKSICANKWIKLNKENNIYFDHSLWQRNYYERIIAEDNDYAAIWEYIDANPDKWESDRNFKK